MAAALEIMISPRSAVRAWTQTDEAPAFTLKDLPSGASKSRGNASQAGYMPLSLTVSRNTSDANS